MLLSKAFEILQSKAAAFFAEHSGNQDLNGLLLKYAADPERRFLTEQLIQRRKLKAKLPSWSQNPFLYFPKGVPTEQSSSEETAKLKARHFSGESLLDITGGMGVDAYFLSSQFARTELYEQNRELAQITAYNLAALQSNVLVQPRAFSPDLLGKHYSLIYADPARRDSQNRQVWSLENSEPNILEWVDTLLNHCDRLLVKCSPMVDLDAIRAELPQLSEIQVVSVRNECKEVLLLCQKDAVDIQIKSWNLTPTGEEYFEAPFSVRSQRSDIGTELQSYLYEPNSSILKAFLADALALECGLKKLHPNTHFYTSDQCMLNYPGKVFQLQQVTKPYDKSLKGQRFNVISRNFYDKASEIQARLRIKSAKSDYLLAFTRSTAAQSDVVEFAQARLLSPGKTQSVL